MTDEEQRELERDSREDALIIGGALAVLLGLRSGNAQWNAEKGKFTVDGRTVSIVTIRKQLSRIETAQGAKMVRFTDDLANKRITADEWQREMKRTVGTSHVLAAALAVGSIRAAVSDTSLQSRVVAERRYADEFAAEVRRDKAGTTARIRSRAKSYLLAAIVTYTVLEQVVRGAIGYREAKRVRRASESCPGCIAYSGRWIPINEMPRIGSLQCGSKCRCFMEYR